VKNRAGAVFVEFIKIPCLSPLFNLQVLAGLFVQAAGKQNPAEPDREDSGANPVSDRTAIAKGY
jgi:hypothetical protein